MARKLNDYAELKLRMREGLRSKIEAAAKENGVSLNQEAIDRLEVTFDADAHVSTVGALLEALTGDPLNAKLLQMVGATLNSVDDLRADISPRTPSHQQFFVDFARMATSIVVDRFFAIEAAVMKTEEDLEKMAAPHRSACRLANLILKRNGYPPIIDPESDSMMKGISVLGTLMGMEPPLRKVIE